MHHFPVFCTLKLLSNINSQITSNSSGMSLFYTYNVSSIYLGNSFYNPYNTKVKVIDTYLTNFTNFVSVLMDNKKLIDKPNYLGQEKSSTLADSRLTYHLCQSNRKVTTNGIRQNIIGYQNTYFMRLTFTNYMKDALNLYLDYITDWFSLISNNEESDYRVIIHTDKNDFNYIHPHNLFEINNHYKSLVQIDIKDTYLTNILLSLKEWIKNFLVLDPIYQNINIDNTGKLNQQLQNICIDFEMIFNSYVSSNKAKRVGLKKKIYEALGQMNTGRVNRAMDMLNIKDTKECNRLQVFSELIKRYRNNLSHSPRQKDFNATDFKLILLQSLKVLVTNWLLSQIKIDPQYIKLNYTFKNPFNTFNLKNRFM